MYKCGRRKKYNNYYSKLTIINLRYLEGYLRICKINYVSLYIFYI